MKLAAYIGADPGLSGALALYARIHDPVTGGGGHVIEVMDMPTIKADDGGRTIDMWDLARRLDHWRDGYDVKGVIVEHVHAIPNYIRPDGKKQGMSSSASFNFGESFGCLKQAIASARLPMTLIRPATWKVLYGLRGGRENKDMSRAAASKLFPEYADQWARKKDDGRAEAVLLAHYASRLQ